MRRWSARAATPRQAAPASVPGRPARRREGLRASCSSAPTPPASSSRRPGSRRPSSPGPHRSRPGPVAVVAASGGVNHALAFMLAEAGVGVSLAVGLGNAVDVAAPDVLRYLASDPATRAVALHVESVADGAALTAAVRTLTERVPVVALVVGRNDVADFARSHTGALATSWRVTRAALRQAGAVLVDDERALVDAVTALSALRLPPLPRPAVGIVTGQAGPGLLHIDGLRGCGIPVPALAAATQATARRTASPPDLPGEPRRHRQARRHVRGRPAGRRRRPRDRPREHLRAVRAGQPRPAGRAPPGRSGTRRGRHGRPALAGHRRARRAAQTGRPGADHADRPDQRRRRPRHRRAGAGPGRAPPPVTRRRREA